MNSDIYERLFTLPIDMENEDENFSSPNKILNNFEKEKNFNETNIINEDINFDQIIELLDDFSNNSINKENDNNELKESKYVVFSNEKDKRYIKSLINSSRIYISEILEKNWKLKIKKIIRKMKVQYIQKLKSIENGNLMKNNDFNNNDSYYNNYNIDIFKFNQYNINDNINFSKKI